MFVDRGVKESAQGAEEHLQELQACKGDLVTYTEQLSNCQKKECAVSTPSENQCKAYTAWEWGWKHTAGAIVGGGLVLAAIVIPIYYAMKYKKRMNKIENNLIFIDEALKRALFIGDPMCIDPTCMCKKCKGIKENHETIYLGNDSCFLNTIPKNITPKAFEMDKINYTGNKETYNFVGATREGDPSIYIFVGKRLNNRLYKDVKEHNFN